MDIEICISNDFNDVTLSIEETKELFSKLSYLFSASNENNKTEDECKCDKKNKHKKTQKEILDDIKKFKFCLAEKDNYKYTNSSECYQKSES